MDKEAIARELLAAEISAENHRTATPECGLSHGLVQDAVALRTGGDWPVTVNGESARRAIIAALTKPATAILALQSSERGEVATDALILSHARLRCALEMIAAGHGCPMALAADTLAATLSPAEPSPESREAIIEECAAVVENNQETWSNAEDGSHYFLTPRKHGNIAGLAFASAIRALSAPAHD